MRYLELTRNRKSCKNLQRDSRCSVVIDMDDRPLLGKRSNMAKALLIIGDAEMAEVGSGKQVRIEAGPWKGDYTPERAVAMIISRYLLSQRDGALGLTAESLWELLSRPDVHESRIVKQNAARVVTKIAPKKIQAWDF